MKLPSAPFIRTSLVALAAASVLSVTELVRAIRITPVDAAASAPAVQMARVATTPPPPDIDVEAVGAHDIFQPDRSALPSRYRMPGEHGPVTAETPASSIPIVLGTVVATDGEHFATCQLPNTRPTIVHVGERLGEYTVVAIQPHGVVFKSSSGARIEVASARPGLPPQ